MRVAAVQMTSTDDLDANLRAAESLIAEAAERGADWIALPENFAYLRREGTPLPCAQALDGPIAQALATWARHHDVWLLGGTIPEVIPGRDKLHNTSLLFSPKGERVAVYRKIHLFDVELGDGAGSFRESLHFAGGEEVTVASTAFGAVGLSVCYDLRFPELYRRMVERGARFVTVPSAFAPQTGKDHWEVLLRARAIENQVFVIAPAQVGRHSAERSSYGRSMIVDPWGVILAQAPDRPCVVLADCDPADQDRVRAAIPCLSHRRL